MKLENMDDLAPEVNLIADAEFNFVSIGIISTDETRESGDGDSGAESKDISEFNNNNYPLIEKTEIENKRTNNKEKRISKIPIRQTNKLLAPPPLPSDQTEDQEECNNNLDDLIRKIEGVSDEDDIEVPILEAPEEFRGLCQESDSNASVNKPEERHISEPVYHIDDNTFKAETGDTTRRTEKIRVEAGSAEGAVGGNKNAIIAECAGIREQCVGDDNVPKDNAVVTIMGHVGSVGGAPINTVTTPPAISSKSQDDSVSETSDMCAVNSETADSCAASSCYDAYQQQEHQPPTTTARTSGPSIEIGVAQCAQASGCSRVTTAKVCAALDPAQHQLHLNSSCADTHHQQKNHQKFNQEPVNTSTHYHTVPPSTTEDTCNNNNNSPSAVNNLCWRFKNGRLVFDVVESEREENDRILYSKDLNRKIDENRSRLKYLEQKLKEAGITDEDGVEAASCSNDNFQKTIVLEAEEQVVDKSSTNSSTAATATNNKEVDYDANQNILAGSITCPGSSSSEEEEDILPEAGTRSDFCEFDVRQVDTFTSFNSYWEVYDELDDDELVSDSDSDRSLHHHIIPITAEKNQLAARMGIDGERAAKHNPDRDNLKSLLKRPNGNGKAKETKAKSNRVVFNENKNEFFDADYIILIREECDYDDEDDDGVCTCNQHEMVRLTCCEPNCNCSIYDGYEQTPQSPKFAPPLEFVDAVTLSPPEGYKDMELEEQQLLALQQMARRGAAAAAAAAAQRTAVCRECSVSHDEEDDEDASQSDNEACGETNSDHEEQEEKEKTDQSQQTTPTTPPNDSDSSSYLLETMTMTSPSSEQRREADQDERRSTNVAIPPGGSPINGILKGGRLWKQQSFDANSTKPPEPQQAVSDPAVASDDEGSNRRSVRFIESEQSKRDSCDGASDNTQDDDKDDKHNNPEAPAAKETNSMSPESTEMMLTFKLGNHVLISNNSLKPNSAVRQLFPCTKPLNGKPEDESIHQYLVTAESLRAFEEAKRSKLPQIIQSGETDESIKRAIERNTLRRSLIRYEPRSKKNVQKTDNSLVERIKQLTCDVDDNNATTREDIPLRASPPGEEARNSPEVASLMCKNSDKSFSPSSSSTASSNSSSMSSTYKKITDLFGKREKDAQNNVAGEGGLVGHRQAPSSSSLPDLGNGGSHIHEIVDMNNHCIANKINSSNNESRKQFLSTLAPLTACVSGGVGGNADEYYHYQIGNHVGERASMASSVGTEYSLEDIDEGLKNGGDDESKKIAPDVLAGTPSASESGDELAMFVQQDASRIERIKKKYQPEQQQQPPSSNKDDDDEHDDYGFNRRPSVRGIKPRFGSTTEILQQIQNQLQPPVPTARVAWPYYSESGLTTGVDNKSRNINQQQQQQQQQPPHLANYQYPSNVPDEVVKQNRTLASQYRPTSLQDENIYQNCTNQRCVREVYRANGNQNPTYAAAMKVSASGDYYQSLPRLRNGRPLSPPPLELSKNYHQTMVYIPYNHIEGPYYQSSDYVRVSNQNQINKQRYIEPIYQQRIHATHVDEHHYTSMMPPMPLKPMVRIPLQRSESPLPGQFSTARSTQTPLAAASTCSYYQGAPRYRPVAWPQGRHSFPRYPPSDNVSLTDSDSQHSNGYRQSVDITFTAPSHKDSIPNSPTKPARYLERGVPEGAAANVPSQDSTGNSQSSSSTMTSPTSPQNPAGNQKPLFYAMNV